MPAQFYKTTVYMDGQNFDDARFKDSRLVYSGGALPTFRNATFDNCTFAFEGPAGNTLQYLNFLYHIGGEGIVIDAVSRKPEPFIAKE